MARAIRSGTPLTPELTAHAYRRYLTVQACVYTLDGDRMVYSSAVHRKR